MTAEDYAAAGLDKLTDAERRHLSEWLERYRQGAVTGPPPEPKRLSEMNESEREVVREQRERERNIEIVAKVLPAFRGWSGSTVFHLDNGQVWRQRNAGQFTYSGDDTRVVISKNSWGFYELRLLEADRSVGVSRVK